MIEAAAEEIAESSGIRGIMLWEMAAMRTANQNTGTEAQAIAPILRDDIKSRYFF